MQPSLAAPCSHLKAQQLPWFLILYVASIPVSPKFHFAGIPDLRLSDIFLLLAVVGMVSSNLRAGKKDVLPLLVPIMVVLLFDFVRLLGWPEPGISARRGLLYLFKRTEYFIIFYVAMETVTRYRAGEKMLRVLMLMA